MKHSFFPALTLLLFVLSASSSPADGPSISYEYDNYGNCKAITNEKGIRRVYTYDDYHRCTSYTEPVTANLPAPCVGDCWYSSPPDSSRVWQWSYDRQIDGASTLVSAYAHTANEWRQQIEPAFGSGSGRVTRRTHDVNNRMTSETTGLVMDSAGNVTSGADTETHSYTYEENGQKKTYVDPLSRKTTYAYDWRNRLQSTTEERGNRITSYLYDEVGNKTQVTFPDNKTQKWSGYDAFGQPGTFTDERNNDTNLYYQWGPMKKLQWVETFREKDGGGAEEQQWTNFYYDGVGRHTWTLFPDNDSQNSDSELTQYQFGQVITFKTRHDEWKSIFYDARGREKYETWNNDNNGNPAAPRIDKAWDDANRLTSISNVFSTITYDYDYADQVNSETSAIAGSAAAGQTTYARYPNGDSQVIGYPFSNLVGEARTYTARGQLKSVCLGQATGPYVLMSAPPFVGYSYLADGKIDTQISINGMESGVTTKFGYDTRGYVSSVTHSRNGGTDKLAERTYATRDKRDRITGFTRTGTTTLNPMENGKGDFYQYDAEGQLTNAWYDAVAPTGTSPGDGDPPADGQVQSVVLSSPSDYEGPVTMSCPDSEATIYYKIGYGSPPANPSSSGGSVAYNGTPVPAGHCSDTYIKAVAGKTGMNDSPVSQIAIWSDCGDSTNAPTQAAHTDVFTYDKMGNRMGNNTMASHTDPVTFTRANNGLNQYASWVSPTLYNGNGVLKNEGSYDAIFNALNQPIYISHNGSYVWFGYDSLGRCVKRWSGSSGLASSNPATYFYYDGWNLIEETSGGANILRVYLHGGGIDEILADSTSLNGPWNLHHYDAQGNCILVTDGSGQIKEQYSYDAYGKPHFWTASGQSIADLNAYGNRFLFTGREWMADLQLYDYRARLYHPELGRFIQPDPKQFEAGDYNLYRYCHNDPVNKSDASGLAAVDVTEIHKYVPVLGSHIPTDVKFVVFGSSWIDAGKAGGRAYAGQAHHAKAEMYGRMLQSTSNSSVFAYGKGMLSGHNVHSNGTDYNESVLNSGPIPDGFKPAGTWWVLANHQDPNAWPVHEHGESDRDVLQRAHTNGVLTIPPPPGATMTANHFDYKIYDAECDCDKR